MGIVTSATSSGESVVLVDAKISGNGATRALPSWNVFAVKVQLLVRHASMQQRFMQQRF